MAFIDIRHLTTVFGPDPQGVIGQVEAGIGKQELLETTGHTIGVRDVSLAIERGEIFVIMGLSGSGKSTLVRHINRLIEPTSGELIIAGEDVLRLDAAGLLRLRREKIAMVFQRFGLMPHRTVLANVAYALEVRGVERRVRENSARAWIERVGLQGYEEQYPAQLSGGMQQRVGLARALAADTEIVLMDEAFSALDPLIRSQLQDELVQLQKTARKTIVFITHDLDEALRIGDRIAILKDGVLAQVGSPADILLKPADDYVRAFVRDVNRARALTVEALMKPPELRLDDQSIDAALEAMHKAGTAYGYVITDGRYTGVVTQQTLEAASEAGQREPSLADLVQEVPSITPDQPIEQALPLLLDAAAPIPVLDKEGTLRGIVSQVDVGAMLATRHEGDAGETNRGAGEACAERPLVDNPPA